MKRSAPIAGLVFCGVALLLPLLSTALLCSGLIRVKLKPKSKGKGSLLRAAPLLSSDKACTKAASA